MKQRILITPRTFGVVDEGPIRYLEEKGYEVIMNPYDRLLTQEELIELIPDVDGIIVGLDPLDKRVLQSAKKLKVISKYGVGIDNIDMGFATSCGMTVTRTPGTNTKAVAELTIGLMLDVARQISYSFQNIRRGTWARSQGFELNDKVLGLIGTGQIGKEVGRLARAFGMHILCNDVYPDQDWAAHLSAQYVPLDELLSKADVVSLHIPLCEETYHFVSTAELALLKPTAIVINTARGGVLDERALFTALQEREILGAGLDVVETEPPLDSPLVGFDNVVMTAHIGSHTSESIAKMSWLAVENLLAELSGGHSGHVVNYS